ncbi:MAG: hypothetical protein K5657_08050 [Desulfovibrio sp.]|nr:hypothetical protein [Desulfovibrio sp.]
MIARSLLNNATRPSKRGMKFQFNRKTSDDCLLVRYSVQVLNFEFEDLAEILSMDPEDVKKMYYGFKTKGNKEGFEALYNLFSIDKYIFLSYAYDWKENEGSISLDQPFPVHILGYNGKMTDERYWFQNGWFEQNFGNEHNVSVMKITFNYLSDYGFNRDDIVIASRLPEHITFKIHNVYMIQEEDGNIVPMISDNHIENGIITDKILFNAMNPDDKISFSQLESGYTMIGCIVWKAAMM